MTPRYTMVRMPWPAKGVARGSAAVMLDLSCTTSSGAMCSSCPPGGREDELLEGELHHVQLDRAYRRTAIQVNRNRTGEGKVIKIGRDVEVVITGRHLRGQNVAFSRHRFSLFLFLSKERERKRKCNK
ncbi:aminopeptidase [Strigomonas culicis]|uniref:Aminopeptidase n=1 Tax=Strigomonas culicis TaxID=28005 RepID=S9WIF0_9TRYP|nr:aminopeptidase [Strigomonas culicis]|eukprot:EPY35615.1 aminopeptidase [Strigomonas culicis]